MITILRNLLILRKSKTEKSHRRAEARYTAHIRDYNDARYTQTKHGLPMEAAEHAINGSGSTSGQLAGREPIHTSMSSRRRPRFFSIGRRWRRCKSNRWLQQSL